jgi:hypothetical protein
VDDAVEPGEPDADTPVVEVGCGVRVVEVEPEEVADCVAPASPALVVPEPVAVQAPRRRLIDRAAAAAAATLTAAPAAS